MQKEMKAATKWHDNSRQFHAASVHEEKEDNRILFHIAKLPDVHKNPQSPCLRLSFCFHYKTWGCTQQLLNSPGCKAFRIANLEMESAPPRCVTT